MPLPRDLYHQIKVRFRWSPLIINRYAGFSIESEFRNDPGAPGSPVDTERVLQFAEKLLRSRRKPVEIRPESCAETFQGVDVDSEPRGYESARIWSAGSSFTCAAYNLDLISS